MKKFLILFFLFSGSCFANLYLQTSYQEGNKPVITTKHHIFLDKPYKISYTKKSYVLILKKVENNEATIENENYDLDNIGHKTMHGGGYGTYKVGKSFNITDTQRGRKIFNLKITLEKIVPTIP